MAVLVVEISAFSLCEGDRTQLSLKLTYLPLGVLGCIRYGVETCVTAPEFLPARSEDFSQRFLGFFCMSVSNSA